MRGRDVRQVADGMLAKVGPKPSIAKLSASVAREQAVVTSKSGKINPTMLDVPPVGGTYKMRMNRFVARDISVGLDGQTKAYIKPRLCLQGNCRLRQLQRCVGASGRWKSHEH